MVWHYWSGFGLLHLVAACSGLHSGVVQLTYSGINGELSGPGIIVVEGGLLSHVHSPEVLHICLCFACSLHLTSLALWGNLSGASSMVAESGALSTFACYGLCNSAFLGFTRCLHGLSGIIGKLDRLWYSSRRVRLAIRVCLLWAITFWIFICAWHA